MSRINSAAFPSSVVHAHDPAYKYRRGFGMINSAEWIVFFDDFCAATPATNVPPGWVAAIIDTGATITNNTADPGGVLRITSDGASEGASTYMPLKVKLTGKKFMMEVRCRVDDADDIAVQFGLTDLTATTNPEDLWTTASADFISFGTLDGSATPKLFYDKNNGGPVTETPSATTWDLADNTWVTLAITYNGATTPTDGALKAYVNGNEVAAANTEAQVPEDLVLAPFIGGVGGNGSVGIIDYDYVRISLER